jgi:HEAT repeat protein
MPELIAATRANRNLNRDLVELAAEAIGSIGPQATPAVPALMDLLGENDANVHGRAADALAKIGPEAVPALIKALSDPVAAKRKAATWALGKMGPGATAAVPDLRRLASDPSPLVASGAQQALYRIEKK